MNAWEYISTQSKQRTITYSETNNQDSLHETAICYRAYSQE